MLRLPPSPVPWHPQALVPSASGVGWGVKQEQMPPRRRWAQPQPVPTRAAMPTRHGRLYSSLRVALLNAPGFIYTYNAYMIGVARMFYTVCVFAHRTRL